MLIPVPESDEHAAFRESLRGFFERRAADAQLRLTAESDQGYDSSLWHDMAGQLGLHGLTQPQEAGGSGFSLAESLVMHHEMGRALLCSPYVISVDVSCTILSALGERAPVPRWVGDLVSGRRVATTALTHLESRSPASAVRACQDGEGAWRLTGTLQRVPWAQVADLIVVVVPRDDGHALYVVELPASDVTITPLQTLDLGYRAATVELRGALAVPVGQPGAVAAALESGVRAGSIAMAAEATGAAERLLETTLDYTRNRGQFGRPIASFQAIKHRLADMALELELMKAAVGAASAGPELGNGEYSKAVHVAAIFCGGSFSRMAAEAIQLHGGIGFTWEHTAHFYFRRAKTFEALFLNAASHGQAMLAELGV
jgi:alkylation response protein AidB-like acyl-CoA dehydrogenase